ncbi:TetR/AcrR family transcriptional regulator [Eupransor demetentiae]|uniref:AcrR family n=1 Tax=Eupransor demetentiae TaxID=3109584 RepID=A0ABM9N3N4_9LACO|nr:AcrR family [Lactobacillaceae bacterium LMG 33000]
MTRNENDARVVRTKQMLRKAGMELITQKSDFSIANLLEKVQITRGTFYRHYHNKADLIRDINQTLIHEILDCSPEQFNVAAVIGVISEQAVFYNVVLNEAVDQDFTKELMQELRGRLNKELSQLTDSQLKRHLAYQWEVIMAGFWAGMAKWLSDGMDMSQDELLSEFSEIWRVNMSASGQTGLNLFDFTAPA